MSIFLYKTLDEELLEKLSFSRKNVNIKFYFTNKNNKKEKIPYKQNENEIILNDLLISDWEIEKNDLFIEIDFKFNPFLLFGKDSLVNEKNEIVIGTTYKSYDSKLRLTQKNNTLSCVNKLSENKIEIYFPKSMLKRKLGLSTSLYLGNINSRIINNAQATSEGDFLGELFNFTIYLEGYGSLFPIINYSNKSDSLLWRLEIDTIEPDFDSFEKDNIRLLFNIAHKGYKDISSNNITLLTEIFSSAIYMLITYIDNLYNGNWDILKESIEDSIGYVAHDIYSSLELNLDEPIRTFDLIRDYFSKGMQNYEVE